MTKELPNQLRFNKHPRRKNNDLVANMYAHYQTGKSLEQIAEIYGRTRQAVYDVLRTRGYALRSKPLRGLVTILGVKFTLMKGGYLRGTTPLGRITAQKYVWERKRGPVPEGAVLHFLDGDKTNVELENLAIVAVADMARTFNPGHHNQHTKK